MCYRLMKRIKNLVLLSLLAVASTVNAQDAPSPQIEPTVENTDTVAKHRNIIQKIVDYVNDKDNSSLEKKGLSWSFIGGPYYSSDVKFGVAITGTANYRLKGCDHSMQPSFASAYATISTKGFWTVGMEGTTFFAQDKSRLNYEMSFAYAPRNFWGMGYEAGSIDSMSVNLKQNEARVHLEYVMKLMPNFFIGPSAEWIYDKAGTMERPELLAGQDRVVRNYGLGFTVQYDSRDLITNASRGVYVHLNTMFKPKFMWNKYAFTTVDFTTSYYHTAWRDAIIAGQVCTKFNFGNPSWASMALLGGNEMMRGYYKGRFRDKHMASAQVELRQHIWRRNGVVVWGGIGNVFHDGESFKKHWLPNYGIGYRWEFRKRMNIRLDLGFGKHGQSGVIFSMNEAF